MVNLNFRVNSVLNQMPEAFSEMLEVIKSQRDYIAELEEMISRQSQLPEFVKPVDVAKRIGVSIPHLYDLLRQGKIEAAKAGKRWIVKSESVEKYLNGTTNRKAS